ncbi:hypothetical protein CMV_005346 [Castanea mollissima]|uniref:Uncharacterized protein n=1 Tax=Castanea mollissima TaxID=60419 RepID=A0A8J4RX99_9ROSI|nr:hypothetical protein CMV_005346 [Castanea mollissima]
MLLWVQWRINPASMLATLSTSSSCFDFRLRFDLIALPIYLSFGLGLGAWVGGLGRWKGWVGVGVFSSTDFPVNPFETDRRLSANCS